jgi:SET domain-containing protein
MPIKSVKVKRGLAGLGLFALEDINKGELIIEYIGNILNKEESDAAKANMYLFEVNRNKTIDGSVRWNMARYINHSCDGNAESEIRKGRVYVRISTAECQIY